MGIRGLMKKETRDRQTHVDTEDKEEKGEGFVQEGWCFNEKETIFSAQLKPANTDFFCEKRLITR